MKRKLRGIKLQVQLEGSYTRGQSQMVFSGAREHNRKNGHKVCFQSVRLDIEGKVFPEEDGAALVQVTREVEDLLP